MRTDLKARLNDLIRRDQETRRETEALQAQAAELICTLQEMDLEDE